MSDQPSWLAPFRPMRRRWADRPSLVRALTIKASYRPDPTRPSPTQGFAAGGSASS